MGTTHTNHNKDGSQNHENVLNLALDGSYMGAYNCQSLLNRMPNFYAVYCR